GHAVEQVCDAPGPAAGAGSESGQVDAGDGGSPGLGGPPPVDLVVGEFAGAEVPRRARDLDRIGRVDARDDRLGFGGELEDGELVESTSEFDGVGAIKSVDPLVGVVPPGLLVAAHPVAWAEDSATMEVAHNVGDRSRHRRSPPVQPSGDREPHALRRRQPGRRAAAHQAVLLSSRGMTPGYFRETPRHSSRKLTRGGDA
nr:hypothetical protein [Actinomycetota bacterium]